MTTRASFAFLREGTSDDGLVPHLSELLIRGGLDQVTGTARDYKGPIGARLEQVAAEETVVDIVFVHRDTDGPSDAERRSEIATAVEEIEDGFQAIVIPVVPIQELEAWLLLDEAAIRHVVGKPSKRAPLNLPKLARVEVTNSPKEILRAALLTASETSGRRLKEEKARFSERRRTLLERLDIDGPIQELRAWQALVRDVDAAVQRLLAR